MFDSILIANRGEIACRVMRTAKRMGLRTIAVYSDADAHAQHVRLADAAYRVGPAAARDSYLNIDALLQVIADSGAQAVHPGYGFLSENAGFAQACEKAGVTFVGPSAEAIRVMGSKIEAKRLVREAGAPVVPGYEGDDQSDDVLQAQAETTGYPLLIKASAGGGGKGMRLVEQSGDFARELAAARREALAAFADDRVLLERYLTAPKHIEVQLLADNSGHTLYLHERDCSVQRRHQKVIEEAPGPTITAQLRQQLGEAAVRAAKSVSYTGAGTVEFIAEGEEFFFMEMNTRLQVEHPVTEAITGLDLVEWQLRIAAGESLDIAQADVPLQGHAIEVRLYAENPGKRFLPSTGPLVRFAPGGSVRVDSGFSAGDEVTVHYDPMLAKLIAHGSNREQARQRLAAALAESQVAGIEHNLGYLKNLLQHPQFVAGDYTTGIADSVHNEVVPQVTDEHAALAALFVTYGEVHSSAPGAWANLDGFRLNHTASANVALLHGKKRVAVSVSGDLGQSAIQVGASAIVARNVAVCGDRVEAWLNDVRFVATLARDGATLFVMHDGHTVRYTDLNRDVSRFAQTATGSGSIVAPLPGQVVKIAVEVGDKVRVGDLLAVVEAMKMEHSITAGAAGVVTAVAVSEGQRVDEGVQLVEVDTGS